MQESTEQLAQEISRNKMSSLFLLLFGSSLFAGMYFTKKADKKIFSTEGYLSSSTTSRLQSQKKQKIKQIKQFKDSEDTDSYGNNEKKVLLNNNIEHLSLKEKFSNQSRLTLQKKKSTKQVKQQKKLKKGDNSYSDEEESDIDSLQGDLQNEYISLEQMFLDILPTTSTKKTRQKIKIAITTDNKEKIQATKLVVQQLFPKYQDKIQIIAFKCNSMIPHGQPWGTQHTYEGANSRLVDLKEKVKKLRLEPITEFDFLISIENGVFSILDHSGNQGQDIACVVVEKKVVIEKQVPISLKDSQTTANTSNQSKTQKQITWERQYGFSQARPYPLTEVFEAKKNGVSNKDIGQLCKKFYDDRPMILSRFEQMENCLESVFKMFITNNTSPDLADNNNQTILNAQNN